MTKCVRCPLPAKRGKKRCEAHLAELAQQAQERRDERARLARSGRCPECGHAVSRARGGGG